jgi:hypothetical protein
MALTVTLLGVLVVAGLLLVARYGADSRTSGDPTCRDAAWPTGPVREHTPRQDLRLARAWFAQLRCWELFERSLRPWEAPGAPVAPVRTGTSRA